LTANKLAQAEQHSSGSAAEKSHLVNKKDMMNASDLLSPAEVEAKFSDTNRAPVVSVVAESDASDSGSESSDVRGKGMDFGGGSGTKNKHRKKKGSKEIRSSSSKDKPAFRQNRAEGTGFKWFKPQWLLILCL
jgi:hypothetical protein